jgi:hypothetical protein
VLAIKRQRISLLMGSKTPIFARGEARRCAAKFCHPALIGHLDRAIPGCLSLICRVYVRDQVPEFRNATRRTMAIIAAASIPLLTVNPPYSSYVFDRSKYPSPHKLPLKIIVAAHFVHLHSRLDGRVVVVPIDHYASGSPIVAI